MYPAVSEVLEEPVFDSCGDDQSILALIPEYMYNAMIPLPKTLEFQLPPKCSCLHLSSSILLGRIHVVPLLLIGLGILQEFPENS